MQHLQQLDINCAAGAASPAPIYQHCQLRQTEQKLIEYKSDPGLLQGFLLSQFLAGVLVLIMTCYVGR